MASVNYKKSVEIVKSNKVNLAKEAMRRSYSVPKELLSTPSAWASLSLIDYNALCIAIMREDERKNQMMVQEDERTNHISYSDRATASQHPETSASFLTPPDSGESSTTASGSTSPTPQVLSTTATSSASSTTGMSHMVDFVFAPGATNAPHTAHKTTKIHLEGDSFEMVVDPETDASVKKIRIFTKEETKHQEKLVNEWRQKIQMSLQ